LGFFLSSSSSSNNVCNTATLLRLVFCVQKFFYGPAIDEFYELFNGRKKGGKNPE